MRAFTLVMVCLIGLCQPVDSVADPAAPALAVQAIDVAERRKAKKVVTLDRPRVRAKRVVLTGRAGPRARVRIERRTSRGWVRVGTGRANRNGRFREALPRRRAVGKVRAVWGTRTSSPRRVIAPPAPPPVREVAPAPVDECGTRPQRADGSYYECSFLEDFEGTELDTSKWLVQETWFSGMTTAHQDCFVKSDEAIAVRDGVLRLTAIRGLEKFTCPSPLGSFESTSTAATVTTRDRFAQTYGRFSIRAKMPALAGTPGTLSALWLYPQKHTYGKWPYSGEVDIAEWWSGAPEKVYPSVHYHGEPVPHSTGGNCPVANPTSQFHTYTVDWSPTEMRFTYDGRLCFTWDWRATSTLTDGKPFDATPYRTTLTVDWVRAWK
jgi:hypothetical protein